MNGDDDLQFVPYVRRAMSGQIDEIGSWQKVTDQQTIGFTVPETGDEAIVEVGILVEYFGRLRYQGNVSISDFEVSGNGKTRIDPAIEAEEWGAITRFTWNRGHWKLEDGHIIGLTVSNADLWTGHSYATDQSINAALTPQAGNSHLLTVRAQGAERYYAAGFSAGNLVILREDFGTEILAEMPFKRDLGREYAVSLSVHGSEITLKIDGAEHLKATDQRFKYGMCGLRMASAGRMAVGIIEIEEG